MPTSTLMYCSAYYIQNDIQYKFKCRGRMYFSSLLNATTDLLRDRSAYSLWIACQLKPKLEPSKNAKSFLQTGERMWSRMNCNPTYQQLDLATNKFKHLHCLLNHVWQPCLPRAELWVGGRTKSEPTLALLLPQSFLSAIVFLTPTHKVAVT